MRQIIIIFLFFITTVLSKPLFAQVIWSENFDTPDKGVWADSLGEIHTDFTNISWTLEYSGCTFSNETDYAKTVTTDGGRFEVLDSDGEVIWKSNTIDVSAFSNFKISLSTSEIGSSTAADKKYIQAFYQLDNVMHVFAPNSMVTGNWGAKTLVAEKLHGDSLQVVIKLNSSYASEKVIIDQITVEEVDTTLYTPQAIQLSQFPTYTITGSEIKVAAIVVNKAGNPINDQQFDLRFQGEGLTVTDSSFTNGVYRWTFITNTAGDQRIRIYDSAGKLLTMEKSLTVFDSNNLLYFQNFETSSIPNWHTSNQWELSNTEPISDDQSMKHIVQAENGISQLRYLNNPGWNLLDGEYFFSFKLKNGDWDPSSSNSFYVAFIDYLVKTGEGNDDFSTGYAIGVNAVGSTDLLSLWRVEMGIPTDLILETDLDWEANTIAQIDFSQSPDGKLSLTATDLNSGQTYTDSTTTFTQNILNTITLNFTYSKTRSGLLWFDDLLVARRNSGPVIQNCSVESEGIIKVVFSEPIITDALQKEQFHLQGRNGSKPTVTSIQALDNTTLLLNVENITNPYLTISANNVADLESAITPQTQYPFKYILSANQHDVVINEIMADPTPEVGLPNSEYIEIYNQSSNFIGLHNWTLKVKSSIYSLPDSVIYPGQQLILCHPSDSSLLKITDHIVFVAGFPSLLNGGTSITLSTAEANQIDSISYTDKWYHNDLKDNGGWSLERINPNRFCGQSDNWTASTDAMGGTPGRINSTYADNWDNIPPEILSVKAIDYSRFVVQFTEPIDANEISDRFNWRINPSLSVESREYNQQENSITLTTSSPIALNTSYRLLIFHMTDECGNISMERSAELTITHLNPNDVLISEVLFNPVVGGSDYVELYNNTSLTFNVSNLFFATRDADLNLKSVYQLGKEEIMFQPRSYLAFTKEAENITANFVVRDAENLIEVENLPALADAEGRIVVLNDSMVVLDEFAYYETMHSPMLSSKEGVALERLSFTTATNTPDNWYSASSLSGYGTPGYANSQKEAEENTKTEMVLESDVVSPNGDGYNDQLLVSFVLDEPGYMANIYIFDTAGHEVNRLTNNDLIGNRNQIAYDCTKANGRLLTLGTYIVMAELINPNGKHEGFKKAFLVTDVK